MPPEKTPRQQGTVISFLPRKGYGFIQGDDGAKVFVHFSDIRSDAYRTLVAGERVEYTLSKEQRGSQARDVVRLKPPDIAADSAPIPSGRTW